DYYCYSYAGSYTSLF
nr:immunoglobulin light chain junction region [Macaca mulatta]